MMIRSIVYLVFVALVGCATTSAPPPKQTLRATPAPPLAATAPAYAGAVWPENSPALHAESAILIDARTGEVLFQKNADTPRQVASTQKLLTALIIANSGNLESSVTIAPQDTHVEPTKLGIRPGERYSRRSLLESMLVKSCNDVAAALARDNGGSQENFVNRMNSTAWALGARNSHFANPHGLPAAQHSTARDMARIAFYAYRNSDLRRYMQERQTVFRHNNGRTTVLKATNKLLDRSPAFNGMKTGYTNAAGRCLVSSGYMNGREVILVQLGSKSKYIFDDAQRVMAWSPHQVFTGFTTAYLDR